MEQYQRQLTRVLGARVTSKDPATAMKDAESVAQHQCNTGNVTAEYGIEPAPLEQDANSPDDQNQNVKGRDEAVDLHGPSNETEELNRRMKESLSVVPPTESLSVNSTAEPQSGYSTTDSPESCHFPRSRLVRSLYLRFHESLGSIEQFLGETSKWQVARFSTPYTIAAAIDFSSIVVKVANGPHQYAHMQELKVLRHLCRVGEHAPSPPSIAKLVWDPVQDESDRPLTFDGTGGWGAVQFGITPPGGPFETSKFKSRLQWNHAFNSLVDGLEWLHKQARVVHRDIRPANIILHGRTAVIIDFDSALLLPADEAETAEETIYEGGLVCVPTVVVRTALRKIQSGEDGRVQNVVYRPKPQDDLCALVLLVLQLMSPSKWEQFEGGLIRGEQAESPLARIERLHNELTDCPCWGKYWKGAQDLNYNLLREIKAFIFF